MRKRKIVLVGAGSTAFTQGLISDIITTGGEWEVRMVDINEKNLEVAYLLADKMVKAKNANVILKKSTDRKEMFPGADAIVTTIATGGRQAWEKDIYIPRKYGVYYPVGDTIGPGGIARALRHIPVVVDIANDAYRLAPSTFFFNYTNPMAMVCRGVRKATPTKIIGLCHGVMGIALHLANIFKVPLEKCKYTAVGINHLTWFLEFRINNEDGWEIMRKRLADEKFDDPGNKFCWELFKVFDAFPAVFDGHVVEFFPQFFREGKYYGKTIGVDTHLFEDVIKRYEEKYSVMEECAYGKRPVDESMFRKLGEGSELIWILNALETDEGGIFSATVPNTGQVKNLPSDVPLECPVHFSKKGIKPVDIGEIPTGIKATVEKAFLTVELAVEAALERSRKKFVQALIVDGSVKSIEDAHKLADELIEAHKEILPGW